MRGIRTTFNLRSISLLLLSVGCSGENPTRQQPEEPIPYEQLDAGPQPDSAPVGEADAAMEDPATAKCDSNQTLAAECCDESERCGSVCCGARQMCFAGNCVEPMGSCHADGDCQGSEYCEFGLGSGARVDNACSALADGQCVALPKNCSEAMAGEDCIANPGTCQYRPPVGDLQAEVQWEWNDSNATLPDFVDVWSTPMVGRVADTNCDMKVDRSDVPAVVFVSGELLVDDADPLSGVQCAGGENGNAGACQRGVLRVLAGDDGRELLTLPSVGNSAGFLGNTVALADVTQDGVLDIIAITAEAHIVVVSGSGELLMKSSIAVTNVGKSLGWGGGPSVADVDQDGYAEIAFAGSVFTTKGGTLAHIWTADVLPAVNKSLEFFADVHPSAGLEFVTGRALYAANGKRLWYREDLAFGFPAVADLQNDGTPEIILVESGRVSVLHPQTGIDVFAPFMLGDQGSGGPPTVADFDGDGYAEIGVAQKNAYYTVKPNLKGRWLEEAWAAPNHDKSSSVTGSTVFDFQGDGAAEVIYNDECFLWVYDGKTGEVRYATPTKSFTATESNVVADVDADGHAEMLWVANRANAESWNCEDDGWDQPDPVTKRPAWKRPQDGGMWRGVRVYRDAANSWVGTRQIWNQHAYSVTNICSGDDNACSPDQAYGSVPKNRIENYTLPWANSFRQNIQEDGIFDAPDAVVDILDVACEEHRNMTIRLANRGRAILPAGVKVDVFAVDDDSQSKIGTVVSDHPLLPGRAMTFDYEPMNMPPETAGFVARVSADNTQFNECDLGNNDSPVRSPVGCLR